MSREHCKYTVLTALVIILISGCSSHGKLSLTPKGESDSLLADLTANTDQYAVCYHGNSEKIVSGILFDPKNDDKTIKPEGFLWAEVNDPQTIADIIDRIKRGDFPGYIPRLYRIAGPEGDFYGYIFTGWSYLAIKPVDEHTLRVYGLEGPPEYSDMRRGGL